jgi:glycerophosphoryl diester phosphodiesterase
MNLFEAIKAKKTLVFGHRGASAYAPMNTLEAFQLAVELGADGVELDVHRSADGRLVIVHDFTVDGSTNGTGKVAEMTLAQLKELDAGSWKDAKFTGAKVPTLDEVFEAVGQELFINVEIKSMTVETDGVEKLVAELIEQYNMADRVVVSSFNPLAIQRFKAYAPHVAIGYLTADDVPAEITAYAEGMTYEAYHPYEKSITPELVQEMDAKGVIVNTWTVNDPVRAVELAQMGVSVIITDKPDLIKEALDSR